MKIKFKKTITCNDDNILRCVYDKNILMEVHLIKLTGQKGRPKILKKFYRNKDFTVK